MEEKKDWCETINKQTEEQIEKLAETGVNVNNVEYLYKLIDIHKDLANEKYWKEKISMKYRESGNYGAYGNYGNYGEESYGKYEDNRYGAYGRQRDSRGRYMAGGYNTYRNADPMKDLVSSYEEYTESRDSYSGKSDKIISLDYMLQSVVQFMDTLKNDANSQEEQELIKKYSKKISEM